MPRKRELSRLAFPVSALICLSDPDSALASILLACPSATRNDSAMKWRRRYSVIRKAISCDVCGIEMLNANHWFVARESGTELRISVWSGQKQIRGSCRHLCGHKCLHKLLDDFTARALQFSSMPGEKRPIAEAIPQHTTSTLVRQAASPAPHVPVIGSCVVEPESSARLLTPPQPFLERTPSHQLYAEAWKRERERQQQLTDRRSIA